MPPGAEYPFTVRATAGSSGAQAATLRLDLPPSASFLSSTPSPTSGSGSAWMWQLGTLAPDQTTRIVIQARAASLAQDPEIIWKDLSAVASLNYSVGGVAQPALQSRTNGPRVTTLQSARYGDRPFPMINVQYQDVKHCTGVGEPYGECTGNHTADGLDAAVNSRTSGHSFWQLYHEVSLGQLNPQGAVTAAALPDAVPFSGVGGRRWSQPSPQGLCTGVTLGGADGTSAYPNRVEGGWYTLPGTQSYYGADGTGHGLLGALTGQGLLFGVDNACGPSGKIVYDAASIADPDLDYNDFDTDRDGLVDFFMLIYAGDGGNGSASQTGLNNVWPHSGNLIYWFTDANGQKGYVSDDQLRDVGERPLWWTNASRVATTTADMGAALKAYVRVGPYNVNPEAAQDRISIIAHEYGHSLGLPDFYSIGARATFGTWELMATDHAQFMTSFSRQDLGWVVPREASDGVFTLRESKQDTHQITWRRPDGTPYTLSGTGVHNADVYRVGLPPKPLIDSVPSGTHAWHSGAEDDFGCPTQGGHGLLVRVPEAAQHAGADALTLKFKSRYEIEWDWDYGFVLASADGGNTWRSLSSKKGTTISGFNPNAVACYQTWDNGITGASGDPNSLTNPNRLNGRYPASQWIDDEFDLTPVAGNGELLVLFSYMTDPSVIKRGWFIDDVNVTATEGGSTTTLYSSGFETDQEPTRLFALGSAGWARISSADGLPDDYGYYIELRDRVGWDQDGRGQSDRGPITWEPGLAIIHTDETHGYGNFIAPDPPPQTIVDARPDPGNEFPNLDDAAFTAAPGRNVFDGCTHVDNYTDPSSPDGKWHLRGFRLAVQSMTGLSGDGTSPSAATATIGLDVAPDCSRPLSGAPALRIGSGYEYPDTDGSFKLAWTRPNGAVGPDILQEATLLSTPFTDGAETGMGNWDVSTSGTGAIAWDRSGLKPHAGANAFHASAADGVLDAETVMTLKSEHGVAIPSGVEARLAFWDWYAGEGDDAAIVEVHDGSGWQEVYRATRALGLDSAAPAFATESLTQHLVDLSRFEGRTVRVRFRLVLGPENRALSSPALGWYVDDVAIDLSNWQTIATVAATSFTRHVGAPGSFRYRVRSNFPLGAGATVPSSWSNVLTLVVTQVT